ncbi:hypothetical protein GGI09_008068 [Coemansia sp. S100]|nr:hypothetical protein LPJ71_002517 [Coemansia sp. S17]KAJ2078341.1 hypothetical protein GGI09_008068 [Coemansia sp. S100]
MSLTKRIVAASRKVGRAIRARVTRRRHSTTATATATAIQPIGAAATEAAVASNTSLAKLLASLADEVEACDEDVAACEEAAHNGKPSVNEHNCIVFEHDTAAGNAKPSVAGKTYTDIMERAAIAHATVLRAIIKSWLADTELSRNVSSTAADVLEVLKFSIDRVASPQEGDDAEEELEFLCNNIRLGDCFSRILKTINDAQAVTKKLNSCKETANKIDGLWIKVVLSSLDHNVEFVDESIQYFVDKMAFGGRDLWELNAAIARADRVLDTISRACHH